MNFFKKVLIRTPFLKKVVIRQYYASGIGVFFLNVIFKYILRINAGSSILFNYTSRANKPQKIKIRGLKSNTVYRSFSSSGGCYYQAINGIEIGEGTIWSFCCHFISSNHSFKDLTKHVKGEPIRIGDFVWIAANCVILPEVSIGKHSIVGAGSIVSKSIEPYTIAAGVPAKPIAKRCKSCLDKISLSDDYCAYCQLGQNY